MGDRPSADIFYGVFLGNEGIWKDDPDWEHIPEYIVDSEEFEKVVTALAGVSFDVPYEGNEELFSEYLDAEREVMKACPIKIITGGALAHGNIDTSLAIKESHTRSDWDDNPCNLLGEKILNHGNVTEACWGGELKEWAEKLGLSWSKIEKANPEGPRWIMIVSHG